MPHSARANNVVLEKLGSIRAKALQTSNTGHFIIGLAISRTSPWYRSVWHRITLSDKFQRRH